MAEDRESAGGDDLLWSSGAAWPRGAYLLWGSGAAWPRGDNLLWSCGAAWPGGAYLLWGSGAARAMGLDTPWRKWPLPCFLTASALKLTGPAHSPHHAATELQSRSSPLSHAAPELQSRSSPPADSRSSAMRLPYFQVGQSIDRPCMVLGVTRYVIV